MKTVQLVTPNNLVCGMAALLMIGVTACSKAKPDPKLVARQAVQAEKIVELEEEIQAKKAEHEEKLGKLQEKVAAASQEREALEARTKEVQASIAAHQAAHKAHHEERASLKPADQIIMANGETLPGYISAYANGVFTIETDSGESKKTKAGTIREITFSP